MLCKVQCDSATRAVQWLGVHEHPHLQELSPWQGLGGMSSEALPKLTPRAILCCRCQGVEQAPEGSEELPEAALPSLCLKQVFPKYAKQFSYLRLVDRVAALFIRFLGVKGTTKLGPTGFRTFIRSVGEKLALLVAHLSWQAFAFQGGASACSVTK